MKKELVGLAAEHLPGANWDQVERAVKAILDATLDGAIILRDQIVYDEVTELTLRIERTPDGEGRIRLWGDKLPFKHRDFMFDDTGNLVGTGTGTCPHCSAPGSMLRVVSEV